MVLTRILAPADYGLIAIVISILGFAHVCSDLGLNSAYVQKIDVSPEQRSSLFWLNIAASTGFTAIVMASSPLVGLFFEDDRLPSLVMISATTIFLTALGQQLRFTAEKALNFKPVATIDILAATIGFLTAITLALLDFGVYALVFGSISSIFSGTLLAWIFISKNWRPFWRFRYKDVAPFIKFGGAVVGSGIVGQISMNMDLLLGGRLLSASQLGLYSVPRNLMIQLQFLVNPIITRVGFPLMAQVQQDIPRVRAIYLKMVNMTASTTAPLYIGIGFHSHDVIEVLYGKQWESSGDLLRILAMWGFFRSTINPVGSLLLGMGRADLSMKWNISYVAIVLPVLWVGLQYGTDGLALSMLFLSLAVFIPAWYILVRPLCHARLLDFSVTAFRPFFIASAAFLPAYFLSTPIHNTIMRIIASTGFAVPLYLALSYRFNRDWFYYIFDFISRK